MYKSFSSNCSQGRRLQNNQKQHVNVNFTVVLLRRYYTPDIKLACLVRYLKIINTFLKMIDAQIVHRTLAFQARGIKIHEKLWEIYLFFLEISSIFLGNFFPDLFSV